MIQKAAFDIRLQGYPAANRDAEVTLINKSTGVSVKRKPFLDGQLLLRDLDPGPYEMTVAHPNLVQPIDRRDIRLIPQPFPTRVPVIVRPDLFRDSPIRDIPDADLGPVQQTAASVKSAIAPLGTKAAGEVIRADDWNALVGAVSDLAGALLELTRLVAPLGHNHPELEEKFAEVQGNIRRFSESFGKSLLELRRDIESQNLRRNVEDVLDRAGAEVAVRDRVLRRVEDLEVSVQQATPVFTAKLANTGNTLLTEVNEMAAAQGDRADVFLAEPAVRNLLTVATQYSAAGGQTQPADELKTYGRTTSAVGGGTKFTFARR
jgi:hypothetical protein